ncbi:MAG TPA: 2'-5' RNA ligase family protein [Candidatus Saccharimonadales bacterium]|nr:2'-5' RNA ligase family protein [Candidatus Saccharimonadales bacterium]
MQPGDRLICTLVEPLGVGHRFKEWPLHVTVLPWFRLEDPSYRVAAGLARAFSGIGPFSAKAGKDVRLGPKKNRPARVLEPAGSFPELEARTRSYLHKKRAWLVDETTRTRREYLPHVTYQRGDVLGADRTIYCDRLYVIEQKGDYKEIVAEIPLDG